MHSLAARTWVIEFDGGMIKVICGNGALPREGREEGRRVGATMLVAQSPLDLMV